MEANQTTHSCGKSADSRHSAGSIVGLLGPNGSGKTTLLKILAGINTVYQCNVEIEETSRKFILPKQEVYLTWVLPLRQRLGTMITGR